MGDVLVVDATTGEQSTRPSTAEEDASRAVAGAEVAARQAAADVIASNRNTVEGQLRQLLVDAATAKATLQAIRDTAQPAVTTTAQAQTAIRGLQTQVKQVALVEQELVDRVVNLARLVVGVLDEA